jgi:ATP adenylyltransferase
MEAPEPAEETQVVFRNDLCAVLLNAFPYTSGHLLAMPVRHVADLEDLRPDESAALWGALADAVRALKAAYHPDGLNVGANLGRAAGAGVPGHFHFHALPRWNGDTNFLTALAEVRVLPEALPVTYSRVRDAWPKH